MTDPLPGLLLLAGSVVVLGGSARALVRWHRARRWGRLVSGDLDHPTVLRSERYRLVGRPDLLRRSSRGWTIPVELKRRPAPPRGPFYSHLVQVWAYCLLVEESTGVPPPFGVLRYSDREYAVPWDTASRAELLRVRASALAPYDGRATPSPGRCRRCVWASVCDARSV